MIQKIARLRAIFFWCADGGRKDLKGKGEQWYNLDNRIGGDEDMKLVAIVAAVVAAAVCVTLLCAYICYRLAFYADRKKKLPDDVIDIPRGKAYQPFWTDFETWARRNRAMSHETMSITSFDGLTLCAKYYEYAPGAPIELMFHGYRGNAERDLSGGIQRCFRLGRSAFVVDQRCSGNSQGHTITFGIKEYRDCLLWVDFMVEHFGPDVKIILCGISMGAATVLMASELPLPPQVKGIWADCGYASPEGVLRETIRRRSWPEALFYPLVSLSARVFGGFRVEECTALDAVRHANVPILLIHGEADRIVPCAMAYALRDACASPVTLLTVPDAAHGVSYYMDTASYWKALDQLFETIFN